MGVGRVWQHVLALSVDHLFPVPSNVCDRVLEELSVLERALAPAPDVPCRPGAVAEAPDAEGSVLTGGLSPEAKGQIGVLGPRVLGAAEGFSSGSRESVLDGVGTLFAAGEGVTSYGEAETETMG